MLLYLVYRPQFSLLHANCQLCMIYTRQVSIYGTNLYAA